MKSYDAVIVGSGPNGLAAAITMAQAGHSVLVLEAATNPGGGARSEALTRPGFVHDVCSAVHPLAVASPFFSSMNLEKFGLEWIYSPSVAAHPLDNGEVVLLDQSIEVTASGLGKDKDRYLNFMGALANNWEDLFSDIMQPLLRWPKHPLLLSRFGIPSLLSAATLARNLLKEPRTRALWAGIAAHANAPLEAPGTSAIGLMLQLAAHARGWPFPRGGSQSISTALISYLQFIGGEIQTDFEVKSLQDLPKSRWVFFDLTPRQVLSILGDHLSVSWRNKFHNFRYGAGVFKMDWALSEPIPWKAAGCARAATVHLGGSLEEIILSEYGNDRGLIAEHPYVLLTQPSLFDASRAPAGFHTAWAYCHVPHASDLNRQAAVEAQIERFAPGFRDCILARSALTTSDMQNKNANLIGGDISGGAISLRQLLFRPVIGRNPYKLPIPGFYICSASTPPGPGVHGMGGFNAAQSALQEI
jgi:phytoene dehydrogenase-like protein